MRAYKRLIVHRRVVVNLRDGQSFSGLLIDEKGPLLVLADAQFIESQASGWTPVDGQVYLERDRVLFVQVA